MRFVPVMLSSSIDTIRIANRGRILSSGLMMTLRCDFSVLKTLAGTIPGVKRKKRCSRKAD